MKDLERKIEKHFKDLTQEQLLENLKKLDFEKYIVENEEIYDDDYERWGDGD